MDILIKEPDNFPPRAIERLQRLGTVYRSDEPYPVNRIETVFIRLAERLGPAYHEEHPALSCIVTPTTGLNHLDLEYFATAGVDILSLKGRTEFLDNIHATSEHTLALTLALLRNLPEASNSVRAGTWNRKLFQGREIFGKTVLLVGYGRLGRQTHRLFEAFGARVLAFDIDPKKAGSEIAIPFADGLALADIVSLHVSLDESSTGFFGPSFFGAMKSGAILINTARGELVDQMALLKNLESGHLAGAALDVLWDEPDPLDDTVLNALRQFGPRLVITPHIGGLTWESLSAVEEYMTDLFIDNLDYNGQT